MMSDSPIRDASTVILLRGDGADARVLMGQRGSRAAFMPSKFVFPGGARDAEDADLPLHADLRGSVRAALEQHADPALATAHALAGVRELFEETGLALGRAGAPPDAVPESWRAFFARGLRPDLSTLDFIFRAVTPAGRPRRFDARFFLARAADITGDPDDFSDACDELSHLHWVPLGEARRLDLPFITEIVLSEVEARLRSPGPRPVPFFSHEGVRAHFRMLGA